MFTLWKLLLFYSWEPHVAIADKCELTDYNNNINKLFFNLSYTILGLSVNCYVF